MAKFLFLLLSAVFAVTSAVPLGPRHIKGIQIKNKGLARLWIEMTNEDSFALPPGQMASVILEETWSGKIFARAEECQYQKCNHPYTEAELTFGGDTKEDRYRVTVFNGYNIPMKIQPTGRSSFCKVSSCSLNLEQDCPKMHQIKDDSDKIIGCRPVPGLFQKLCPQAAVVGDETQTFSCKTSDTYFVSVG